MMADNDNDKEKGDGFFGSFKPITATTVRVDYDLPTSVLVRGGEYDWVHELVDDEKFKPEETGTAEFDVEFVHYPQSTSYIKAVADLEERGLRPLTFHELLSFGIQYPEKQKEYAITAHGDYWEDDRGYRLLGVLHYTAEQGRMLNLVWLAHGVQSGVRIAATRV